jgi:hypothetical protein
MYDFMTKGFGFLLEFCSVSCFVLIALEICQCLRGCSIVLYHGRSSVVNFVIICNPIFAVIIVTKHERLNA